MVVHWTRLLAATPARRGPPCTASRAVNLARCLRAPALVLVVVLVTKFTHGAWIVVLAMPALFLLMQGIRTPLRARRRRAAPGPRRA